MDLLIGVWLIRDIADWRNGAYAKVRNITSNDDTHAEDQCFFFALDFVVCNISPSS